MASGPRGAGAGIDQPAAQQQLGDPMPAGHQIAAEALARKLIVLTAGTYVNVIRIIPPLVTTADEVTLALRTLDDALGAARA